MKGTWKDYEPIYQPIYEKIAIIYPWINWDTTSRPSLEFVLDHANDLTQGGFVTILIYDNRCTNYVLIFRILLR